MSAVSNSPQPVNRSALVLALFAFGFVNLGVVLHFADAASQPIVTTLLVVGVLCGLPAWIRLRRS